ncbi:MAG: aminotransferase DegT, partial [Roseococcus sp.]
DRAEEDGVEGLQLLQPAFRDAPHAGGGVAAGFFERGLCLPSGSAMGASQQARVIGIIRALHRR